MQKNLVKTVCGLKNLEELSVTYLKSSPSEDCFHNIGSKLLGLKSLDLSNNAWLGDNDLQSIYNLPKLESLYISGLKKVTGSGFQFLLNLRQLNCFGCSNLEDKNLISLLRRAKNLEHLNVVYCTKITNSVINVAIEETKHRINDLVLEILFDWTSINVKKIKKKSPLLLLSNKCQMHLEEMNIFLG